MCRLACLAAKKTNNAMATLDAEMSSLLSEKRPSWAVRATLSESVTKGPGDIRPRVGLRPTTTQTLAGMRTEPAASLPCATGDRAAATAAPEPPLEGAAGLPAD